MYLACDKIILDSACRSEIELARKRNLNLDASRRRPSYETQINPLLFYQQSSNLSGVP